ncbi:CBU_0592 family membrane protein [Ferrimonas lipolytica]|uniref:CBU-0592-like domain-containing protein n=1 Tax=Ferrimonas lipolytica TaxID=2724191 RepID=A0A6H1UH32_9GAMM|nr:hypothetical protein [Ferrimonas lipolytica]QIZ77939.1 hypothetical protein HER31_14165 [Ferrimonas lipolytica]
MIPFEFDWKTIISLIAVTGYLAPFILLQTGRMAADNPLYSVLNIVGAGLILVTMTYQYNLASLLTNSVWLVFSLFGLQRTLKARAKSKRTETAAQSTA